jgi:diguanylate cyclase (GGDEF)-like protein
MLRNTSPETQIILAGMLFLVLVCTVSVLGARTALYGIVDHRAMARLEVDMRMAHLILDTHGSVSVDQDAMSLGGKILTDSTVVDEISAITGGVSSIFMGDVRVATTVKSEDGRRNIGATLVFVPARNAIFEHRRPFRGIAPILGSEFYTAYDPLLDASGHVMGVLFVGFERADLVSQISHALGQVIMITGCGAVLSGLAFFLVGKRLVGRVAARDAEIHRTSSWLDVALDSMSGGFAVWDGDCRLVLANRRLHELFGFAAGELLPGTLIMDMIKSVIGRCILGDVSEGETMAHRMAILSERRLTTFKARMGDGRTLLMVYRPLGDEGWLTTYEDITDRNRAEAELAHMARHDALTGLGNRILFHERVREGLEVGAGTSLRVLYLDLDHFKGVNDTLGHTVGDALLAQVAVRLLACVRAGDTVVRLGGDEFAVIQIASAATESASSVAARIIEQIRLPYRIDGRAVSIGTSIGISMAPEDGLDADTLLKSADMALYKAKEAGRGSWCFYEGRMGEEALGRHALEADLRQALADGGLEMHYQPLVDVRTGRPRGFEALMRWRHPVKGMIPPLTFIPVAEESGLIVPVGEWGLRQACLDAQTWPDDISVAVNLSPVQFKSPGLLNMVRSILEETGLAPPRLQLEITESVLMQDMDQAREVLHQLRELGVRIAMDDFGTGYACLSYLRNLPFDKIKIDRSFVIDVGHRQDSDAIVKAVTGLASNLGMSSLAEGVETCEQLDYLREQGCDEVQGYLFSKAVPGSELPALIERLERQAWG